MVCLPATRDQAHIQNGHSKRKNSCFLEQFVLLTFNKGLKLFWGQENVPVLGNVISMVENTLEIAFLVKKARLSDFYKRLSVFDAEEDIFESDFIVSENGFICRSIFLDNGIPFNTRDQEVYDFLSCEFEFVYHTRVKLLLHVGQWVIDDDNDLLAFGEKAISLLFDDVYEN